MTGRTMRVEVAAALSGAVVLTGVQGIAPALPAIQEHFDLTDTSVSVIMLVYVLASVFASFPSGLLAQRFGARAVLCGALLIFGAGGLLLLFVHDFALLVVVRMFQGAAFGAVLALSISIIGDSIRGGSMAAAQSRRVVVMSLSEAVLPVAAGFLVLVASWPGVFLLQVLALPAAVLCWFFLRHLESDRPSVEPRPRGSAAREALGALATLTGLAVQAPGFLRFFLKFALLTYFPIVAVRDHGMDAAGVGLAVGLAALFAVAAAAVAPLALRVLRPVWCVSLAIVLAAGPLLLIPVVPNAVALTIVLVVAGIGDGILGVLNNVMVSIAAPIGARSAYIGMTGTIRNVGKLFAPATAGALAAVLPLAGTLALLGGACLLVLAAVPRIGALFAKADNPEIGEGGE